MNKNWKSTECKYVWEHSIMLPGVISRIDGRLFGKPMGSNILESKGM